MMKFYLRFFYLIIPILTLLHIILIVVCESGFIEYIKNQHLLVNVTGREKTLEWIGSFDNHDDIIERYYKPRQTWLTSNLGTYLFKNIDQTKVERLKQPDRMFKVLVWRHWNWLKKRHEWMYNVNWTDALDKCSVDNCKFSGDLDFESADAVIVHLQKGLLPRVGTRNPKQIWVMLTDESPKHTFSLAKKPPKLAELAGVFNWSMTYRSDSDIPVPYGRTLPLQYPKIINVTSKNIQDLVPNWSKKQDNILASILISNCDGRRTKLLKELKKYMDIDVYGKCSENKHFKNSCPGHFRKDCEIMSNYLFYLVFENSKCRQYITEKVFQHAFEKGAIPVIMGPSLIDCHRLLPPNSFLHVDNYQNTEELVLELNNIADNTSKLLSYHAWRNNFRTVGEHGYFDKKSYHLCRICEALNYNDDSPKVYNLDDIQLFLDPRILCS